VLEKRKKRGRYLANYGFPCNRQAKKRREVMRKKGREKWGEGRKQRNRYSK
jgi:hypothetical protein